MTIFKGLPRSTRFLESLVGYLPEWRKALSPLPVILWQDFMGHVRENLNPLAADDHMKEVIQQLQLMGEVCLSPTAKVAVVSSIKGFVAGGVLERRADI